MKSPRVHPSSFQARKMMLRPQFPQLQLYPHLGQQNWLWLPANNVNSSRILSPPQAGSPLRTRTLSSLSLPIFSSLHLEFPAQNYDPEQNTGLGVTECVHYVDQAMSLGRLYLLQRLFPPCWSGENRGLQAVPFQLYHRLAV